MLNKLTPVIAIAVLLGSCTSLKNLASAGNKQAITPSNTDNSKQVKFLDDISVNSQAPENKTVVKHVVHPPVHADINARPAEQAPPTVTPALLKSDIEKSSPVQMKYALLLNTEVEYVQNVPLYNNIDEWYGTRYKLGGTTKKGIDCSAFVQAIFVSTFGITLPRTARDQYKTVKRISRTELKEGDLLFFNTRGRGYISHVGIYLQNNKFVHASVSGGVVISDMFEPYYVKKFAGAGRIVESTESTTSLSAF